MRRSAGHQQAQAGLGQDRVGVPAVPRIGFTPDEAARLGGTVVSPEPLLLLVGRQILVRPAGYLVQ